MSVLTQIVEGWTGRLTFTLKQDGTAIDGTGLTITDVLLTGKDGTEVPTTGDFGWVTAGSGLAYLDADADDFVAGKSPYRIRFKVTDNDGKVVFFPNGPADSLVVHPPRG